MLRDLKDLSSFCEHFIFLTCLAEVATGNLLDLAEGAPTALVHSGKMQKTPDPFTARNHATENNNTVWVRHGPVGPEGFFTRIKGAALMIKGQISIALMYLRP